VVPALGHPDLTSEIPATVLSIDVGAAPGSFEVSEWEQRQHDDGRA
jgi:hypothetical protein